MCKSKCLSLRKKCPHPASVTTNKNAYVLGWMSCLIRESARWVWKQFHKFPLGLIWRCGNGHEGTWTQLCSTLLSIFKHLACPKPQWDPLVFTGVVVDLQKILGEREEAVLNPPPLSSVAPVGLRITLVKLADAPRTPSPTLWDGWGLLPFGFAHVGGRKKLHRRWEHVHTPVHPGAKSCAQLQQQQRARTAA